MKIHYLDNSATSPLCDEAKSAIKYCIENHFGNPSSMHLLGADALIQLDKARETVAAALNCLSKEVYFTSGGTEANNTAIFGAAYARKRDGNHLVTTKIEHPSVLKAFERLEKEGFEVTYISPDTDGNISAQSIANAIRKDTVLVSIMSVNNETGAIIPVNSIKPALKAIGSTAYVHSDCVQAFGKIPVRPELLGADLISISGHKVHAPKGIGALYVSKSIRILPLLVGGGQEKGLRSGTESTLLIDAFAAAIKAMPDVKRTLQEISRLKKTLVERLKAIDTIVINSPDNALPYIVNFSAEGIRSEIMMHHLESVNCYVSSGSACAKGGVSHVLAAQGISRQRADSAIRVSMSRFTNEEDIDALIKGVEQGVALLKKRK